VDRIQGEQLRRESIDRTGLMPGEDPDHPEDAHHWTTVYATRLVSIRRLIASLREAKNPLPQTTRQRTDIQRLELQARHMERRAAFWQVLLTAEQSRTD